MALYQRQESSGRTRFLIALSLSTVTALAVAAPLAIQAVNADEVNFAAGNPGIGQNAGQNDDDLSSGERANRRLGDNDAEAKGGIASRVPAKAQSQTSKSESAEDSPSTNPDTEDSVLTNPSTTTISDDQTPTTDPGSTTTTADPGSTTTTDPGSTTTTDPGSTTTTDPGSTTTTAPSTTSTTPTTSSSTIAIP